MSSTVRAQLNIFDDEDDDDDDDDDDDEELSCIRRDPLV